MAKSINAILNLKDKFTKPLKKSKAEVKAMERTVKQAGNAIKKFGSSVKNMALKSLKYGFAAATAAAGVFLKQSVDAAKAQIDAETKLSAVLKNTKGMTDAHIDSIKKYAGELQNVGVIGDEVNLAGVQQMGTYQLQADTLKKLMPGMNDLLAQTKGLNATQQDAVQVGNLIGKVMSGQVGALKRVGINFTSAQEKVLKFGTEQEKATMLAKVLEQNVGGVNKALSETDQGKIQQAKNAFGDMQEEVGKRVLPYLGKFAGWFMTKIPMIQDFILGTADKVEAFAERAKPHIDKFKDGVEKAIEVAEKIYNFINDYWPLIGPVVAGITAGIIAYKGAMIAAKVPTMVLAAKQLLLNTVMSANPIGAVIALIAGLVAAAILLYKNWDTVKEKASKLWSNMKEAFPILQTLEDGVKKVKEIFDKVANAITKAKDAIFFWNKAKPEDKTIKVDTVTTQSSNGGTSVTQQRESSKKGSNSSGARTLRGRGRATRHALGTRYFQGGLTSIAEGNRPETVILPSGSQILPHGSGPRTSQKVDVKVIVQGNVIGNREFMEETGRHISKEVLLALSNM